jgi:hypothetical protein
LEIGAATSAEGVPILSSRFPSYTVLRFIRKMRMDKRLLIFADYLDTFDTSDCCDLGRKYNSACPPYVILFCEHPSHLLSFRTGAAGDWGHKQTTTD